MHIDLGGAMAERLVIDRLIEAFERWGRLRFPLTNLWLCEWYYRSGLRPTDTPIRNIFARDELARDYYAQYGPYMNHKLNSNLEQLRKAGHRQVYRALSRWGEYRQTLKRAAEKKEDGIKVVQQNQEIYVIMRESFVFELCKQKDSLPAKVNVTNHHYRGSLLQALDRIHWDEPLRLPKAIPDPLPQWHDTVMSPEVVDAVMQSCAVIAVDTQTEPQISGSFAAIQEAVEPLFAGLLLDEMNTIFKQFYRQVQARFPGSLRLFPIALRIADLCWALGDHEEIKTWLTDLDDHIAAFAKSDRLTCEQFLLRKLMIFGTDVPTIKQLAALWPNKCPATPTYETLGPLIQIVKQHPDPDKHPIWVQS